MDCAIPSATNPLGYSDGQQGFQGGFALERSDISTVGTMDCFANMAETTSFASCHSRKPTGLPRRSDMEDLGHEAL